MPAAAAIPMAVGGVGSLIGGIFGSNAANKAGQTLFNAGGQVAGNIGLAGAKAQQGVSNAVDSGQNLISNAQSDVSGAQLNAQGMMSGAWNAQRDNLQPWLAAGNQGISTLQQMMQPGGFLTQQFQAPSAADVENTPGYQFQLQQGNQALKRSAAASGQLSSGGTTKAVDQYTQGLASTYYQNAYNNALGTFQTNRSNAMSSIGALMGAGQFGTSQFNQAAQNYGNTSAASMMQGSEFNAGLSQYAAQLGLSGAQLAGMFGLNSAEASGNAYMQGAGGQAAGTMGSANAWMNALNGMAGSVGYGARMGAFGGGAGSMMGGGGGGYGTYSPSSGDFNYNPYNPYGAPRV